VSVVQGPHSVPPAMRSGLRAWRQDRRIHNSVRQERPETGATARDNTEKGGWTIAGLLWSLARRELDPAIVAFDASGVRTWDSETLADQARRLAHGMRQAGLEHSCAAALWAPNSPVWIIAALAVLAGGGMLVPIDDLAAPEQFEAALKTSNARFVITTRVHLEASSAVLRTHDNIVILVDDDGQTAGDPRSWQSWLHIPTGMLPDPIGDDPAMLCWGTVKLAASRLGGSRASRVNGRDDDASRPNLRRLSIPC
jgi:acyl-CoA synthetase (AMP-forming)/AMP-acid ligase II